MPRTSGPPKYDYNIYQIPIERKNEFIAHLEDRQFEQKELKNYVNDSEEYEYELYYCDKENTKGISWVKELQEITVDSLNDDSYIYGAVLLFTYQEKCFAISYGNAHFYISNYCDLEFGHEVAERLLDLRALKSQKNNSYGTKVSSNIVDYNGLVPLSYRTGEIPTFVQGVSIDTEKWGSIVKCGISAQFKWEAKCFEVHLLLLELADLLDQPVTDSIPRLIKINEEEFPDKVAELKKELCDSLTNDSSESHASVPAFFFSGTKIIQNDIASFKLSCGDRNPITYDDDFEISALVKFAEEKNIDLVEKIDTIGISFTFYTGTSTPILPILKYIDYVNDNNYCLFSGNWYRFNRLYKDTLYRNLGYVSIENICDDHPLIFDREQLEEFASELGMIKPDAKRKETETWYNHYYARHNNLACLHPKTATIEDSFSIEYCDMFNDNELYFVKIGGPGDFAEAVDQANRTLDELERLNNQLQINCDSLQPTSYSAGTPITLSGSMTVVPKEIVFVFILEKRKSKVEKWADISALNFLIHLSDLRNRCAQMSLTPKVQFVYNKENTI